MVRPPKGGVCRMARKELRKPFQIVRMREGAVIIEEKKEFTSRPIGPQIPRGIHAPFARAIKKNTGIILGKQRPLQPGIREIRHKTDLKGGARLRQAGFHHAE